MRILLHFSAHKLISYVKQVGSNTVLNRKPHNENTNFISFFYSFLSFFSLTIIMLHNISTLEVAIMMTTADDKFMTLFKIFSAINALPPG